MRLPLALLASFAAFAPPLLAALPTPDADDGGLILPPGFRALLVADRLTDGRKIDGSGDALRFLAPAPNGDLYAKSYRGGIFALRDTDGDARFDQREEFGSGGGTAIALRGDWLYHSSNTTVYRYKLVPGQLVPTTEPEVIVRDLPDEKNHAAKSFAFDAEGRLLVEVGSPANVFGNHKATPGVWGTQADEHQKTHGGFWRFDADKPGQTLADGFHFSTGHRHALSLAWHPVAKDFFMVMMGRDQLDRAAPAYYDALDNAERISEEMHRLREGSNLGWPYTYWDPIKKARMLAPEYGGDNRIRVTDTKYAAPVVAFPAHWAPLQMAIYTGGQFPAKYRHGAFIAFHGSWNRAPLPQAGYNVAFAPFDAAGNPLGTYEVFVRSDLGNGRTRMSGAALGPDGSLYVGESGRGRIWRILYTGDSTPKPTAPAAAIPIATAAQPAATSAPINPAGRDLYLLQCAPCHMADGTGAGQMNPALAGAAVIQGDPQRLIRVILQGPAAVLPANRPKYSNAMPGYAHLRDSEVAHLVTYLRQTFGNKASAVTSTDIAAARKK
ncbi:MAG: PQQ-dependent sugar dehydrogenase [Burkholderiales bacterium]|nr:PQQ-dependent sugar dehydrogenase [Opitutaceae bacterium]